MIRAVLALAPLVALAGCATPPRGGTTAARLPQPAVDEQAPAAPVRFTVDDGRGGRGELAGLLWMPAAGARTVLLSVHGSGGAKENWGPIPGVPGYSFAHAMLADGRAVVAIDLPGYGESYAPAAQRMEDFARVVDAVARALRDGGYRVAGGAAPRFTRVVGNGLSMGALVVEIAAGAYASFDGVIAAGWSQGGFSAAYRACLYRAACPPSPLSEVWYLPNVEPRVVEWLAHTRPNRLTPGGRTSIHLWGGLVFVPGERGGSGEGAPLPATAPRLDALTRRIRVPVLLLFGARDFTWDLAAVRAEPRHFPAARAVELDLVPDTGHFVRWHRSNADADARVLAWLRRSGF